jgi:hypothetical protein
MQIPPLRFPPATHIVNDQLVGSQFLRQQDRVAFAVIKAGFPSSASGAWLGTRMSSHAGGWAIQSLTASGAGALFSSSQTDGGIRTRPWSFYRTAISPIQIR